MRDAGTWMGLLPFDECLDSSVMRVHCLAPRQLCRVDANSWARRDLSVPLMSNNVGSEGGALHTSRRCPRALLPKENRMRHVVSWA